MVKFIIMRRCPHCKSVWVCWNWYHLTQQEMEEMNPGKTFVGDTWGHECHECENVFDTIHKVKNGMPYRLLMIRSWIEYHVFS